MKQAPSLSEELGKAELGDPRRNERLRQIVSRLEANPSQSFPQAVDDGAELEALYRFMSNEHVDSAALLKPHVVATIDRAESVGRVLVVHDTTEFNFGVTTREGLGRVALGKSRGFLGHFALCVANDGSQMPLGVLGLEPLFRHERKGPRLASVRRSDPNNESLRWARMQKKSGDLLENRAKAVHVMDREADQYPLLAQMVVRGDDFIVRMSQPRNLADGTPVANAIRGARLLTTRAVAVQGRSDSAFPTMRRRHPARAGRTAVLTVSAIRVKLPEPKMSRRTKLASLELNLVIVQENNAPDGEQPIEWRLWTTLPANTAEDGLAIVDAYRARWVIEEFFKALKTGCAYEMRQLSSQGALLNALAVLAPIAWRLLALRSQACRAPDGPQRTLSATQLRCLRAICQRLHRHQLPENPTARQTMLALARMGGHIKNNGDPGWMVLGRGYAALVEADRAVNAVLEDM